MKNIIQNDTYGEIIYEEGFWTGKKTLAINGEEASMLAKNLYLLNGKKITLKGSVFSGVSIVIDNETIQITPKTTWYEYIFTVLPFIFIIIWGNVPALCEILPLVGGAIGGAVSGAVGIIGLYNMKKTKNVGIKLLIGVGAFALTVLICYLLGVAILSALI